MNSFRTTSTRLALTLAVLFFGAFSASAQNPTVFSIGQVPSPNGIVATPDRLLVTSQEQPLTDIGPPAVYHTNIYSLDTLGDATLFSTIPGASVALQEVYLSAAPGVGGGWTAFDIFACRGDKIYQVPAVPGPSIEWVDLPSPAGDRLHCGIAFDNIGNFGFDMIVTTEGSTPVEGGSEGGAVWRVTSAGVATLLEELPFVAGGVGGINPNVTEGPAVTSNTFSGAAGELLVTQELNAGGTIFRINPAGQSFVYKPAFGEAESIHIVPSAVCDYEGTDAGFFTTDFFNDAIIGYPATDFAGEGGNAIVPIEFTSDAAGNLWRISEGDASVSEFDPNPGNPAVVHEGSTFVECGPADMPLRKVSSDPNVPAPDGEFEFGLFPRGDDSFTDPPLGYNAAAADKGAAVTVFAPADLFVPDFPFFASICEIGYPTGWTFSDFTADFTGGSGNSVSPPYNPAGEGDANIFCIDLVITAGTTLIELTATDDPPREDGEACSPGYWRQPHHFGNYPASVNPLTTKYGSVFGDQVLDPTDTDGDGIPYTMENKTFPQVIATGGGGFAMLGRHSGAAYLNSLVLNYGLTPQEVIDLTNDAFLGGVGSADFHLAAGTFEGFLEDENCPLGRAPLPSELRPASLR